MDEELKAYLDQQFQQIRQETAARFAKVDELQDRLRMSILGIHAHDIDFLGQLRLVIESLANITQQLNRYDARVSRELGQAAGSSSPTDQEIQAQVLPLTGKE